MKLVRALIGGVFGAGVLTLLQQVACRYLPHAPRMDVIGMRALARLRHGLGAEVLYDQNRLYRAALVGDLLSNTLYYSLVGGRRGQHPFWRGSLLGLLAGVGAVMLPPRLGLRHPPGERTPATQIMTLALYLVGGLASAAAIRLVGER